MGTKELASAVRQARKRPLWAPSATGRVLPHLAALREELADGA
jgi:hypothetical protein